MRRILIMKKFASVLVLALMAVLMLSVFAPALAEEAAAAATDSAIPAKAIAAAAGAGAIAMGISIGKATEAISRQPEATDSIRGSLMIGLVFIETAIIYALIVAILVVFVL